ncbi:MAG TPA: hypothetical protein VHV55_16180 [Pirellulales bacterium]|jgi:hypothetical protein|nr:hypothetical protein [Pirellulales bacterium]
MIVLLVALALGQATADPVQQQREQILTHLRADMQASGTFDSARYAQAEQQVAKLSADEVGKLASYYTGLKRQVMGQAVAERDQAIALRNQLSTTLAARTSPVFKYPYPAMSAYGPATQLPLPYAQPLMYGNAALYSGFNGMYGAGVYGAMGPYSGVGPYGTGLYGGVGPGALPAGFGPGFYPGALGGVPGYRSTFPGPMMMPPY